MNSTSYDIYACFRLLLGREPNPEELPGHLGMAGTPLSAVVASYLRSLEFKNRNLLQQDTSVEVVNLEGFSIYIAADDYLIAPGIRKGNYEPDVTEAFLKHLAPQSCVLDIGANCGYFSLLACSRGATVYAFEPLQRNLQMLFASRALNAYDRLHVIAAAASDTPGTLSIGTSYTNGMVGEPPKSPGSSLTADYVAAVRVDDCVPPDTPVSLVKIDVEGHEYQALLGAVETIKRCHPVIVFEFNPVSWTRVLGFLTDLAYTVSAVGDCNRIALPQPSRS